VPGTNIILSYVDLLTDDAANYSGAFLVSSKRSSPPFLAVTNVTGGGPSGRVGVRIGSSVLDSSNVVAGSMGGDAHSNRIANMNPDTVNKSCMLEMSGSGGDICAPSGGEIAVELLTWSTAFVGRALDSIATLQGLSGWAAVPFAVLISNFNSPDLVMRSSYWVLCGAALLPSVPLVAAQTSQDIGICAFVAATDIASITNYDEWACGTSGLTTTDPCAGPWTGVTCAAGVVDVVDLTSEGISGRQSIVCAIIYCTWYCCATACCVLLCMLCHII